MSKIRLLNDLYSRYNKDFPEKEIVLGDGNLDAVIMLIGEAPGKDEVKLSKPFVGIAGKNLNEFLQVLGLDRSEIFITNAIKYRLSKYNEKTGRFINRPAKEHEIKDNRKYLLEEIKIIEPNIIVTLGNVPLKSIYCCEKSIGAVHGTVLLIDNDECTYKIFPLYHPASIIYNRGLKKVYFDDVLKLKDILH